MCMAGALVDNATMCGCPPGKIFSANGIFCEFTPCMDGNISVPDGMCSANMQKKCMNGVLVDKATECGCPSGTIQQGELCITQTAETISSCGTLGTANTIYMLDQNVNTAGTCFTITAENVTLDCSGYSITGNNASNTHGIYSDRFNTAIGNCQIGNFQRGIYFNGANNGTIQNVFSYDNSQFAIILYSSSSNTITNSIGISNSGVGFYINGGSSNKISNSTGASSLNSGILIANGLSIGNYNTVVNSTGTSASGHGIDLESSNNAIVNSVGTSNSNAGIYLDGSSNNTITRSIFISNSSNAIYLTYASNNIVTRNTIISGNGAGTLIYYLHDWASSANTVCLNNFTATNGLYVNDANGANFYNCTYDGMNQGNIYGNVVGGSVNITGTVPSSIPGFDIGTGGSGYPYNSTNSQGKVSASVVDYAPLTPTFVSPPSMGNLSTSASPVYAGAVNGTAYNFPVPANLSISASANANYTFSNWTSAGNCTVANATSNATTVEVLGGWCNVTAGFNFVPVINLTFLGSCGSLAVASANYALNQSVSTSGTCFTINAANVTLDCNGYSITGGNATNTYGVNSNIKPGAKLMNCIISNFYTAVYFNGAGNGTIQNVTASGASEGINLKSSLNNTIVQTTATGSIGILINSNSNGNLISNSTGTQAGSCSTSTCAGIQFGSSSFNRIIGSTGISANYHGIRFGGGNNNTVENSTAMSSSSYGIYISTSSNGNTLKHNSISSIAGFALSVDSSSNNTISNSAILSNSSTAAYFNGSGKNIFYNNTLVSPSGTMVHLNPASTNNTFCWNNFTQTTGLYVNDLGSGNRYNGSSCSGEGNIYANVMDGSVNITGNNLSSHGNGLYIGSNGTGYPYNSTNAQGKLLGNVVDYAPLTPYLKIIPPNTPPYIAAITIGPNSPAVNSLLYCNIVAVDAEQSNVTINYTWYLNGTAYLNAATVVSVPNPPDYNINLPLNASITQIGDNWSCSAFASDGVLSSPVSSTANVTVVAPMQISVYKHVINNNGGTKTASDFNMSVSITFGSCGGSNGGGGGGAGAGSPFPFSENGTIIYFYAGTCANGTYYVGEVADSGYAKSIGANCSGTVVNGENRTCTITNDDIAVLGNASSMNASGFTSISVLINGTEASSSSTLNGTLPIAISDNGTQLLNFSYNFSTAMLNLSGITITMGTGSNGAAYVTVAGINSSAIAGAKTVYIYNASNAFNYVCVKDAEGIVGVGQISGACDGASETPVPCTGVNTNGFACTANGTTLTITGLVHSGVKQYYVAPPAPVATTSSSSGNGGGGGGSVGGGSSAASTKQSATVNVDIGLGKTCAVTITREMASTTNLSVLTTTLENIGGINCSMTDFVFADTIPADFPALNDVAFTPQYTSRAGWTVSFEFPTFAVGESKTLSYSANQWIKTSLAKNFTVYTMTAKKQQVATQPPKVPAPAPVQQPVVAQPVKKATVAVPVVPVNPSATAPKANENLLAGALFDSDGNPSLGALSALAIASFVVLSFAVLAVWRKISRN